MTYDPHKTTTEVRQGSRRHMNLRVLVWSMLIVVILFAVIYFFFLGQPSTVTTTQG